ncbi:MAG: calcium/sodium antiporter [Acidobacteria bacterium]|nr:calcium/sodium antiporter [Acidobacteriota bacterium]
MMLNILFLLIGFVILVVGADWLVEGASALAKKFNVSDLAIGLTIVAVGTSMPELVVNVFAAYKEHSDIVFGNILGSNNFNLFVILGAVGMVSPILVPKSSIYKEIPMSLAVAAVLAFFANGFIISSNNVFTRIEGLFFLLLFILFNIYAYTYLKGVQGAKTKHSKEMGFLKIFAYIILGLLFLALGGHLVETKSVLIATYLGISQAVIGLTIVAAGTSMPELATSLVAVLKKKGDIAVGNIIGSNISNILLILGLSALIKPQKYNIRFNQDLAVLVIGTIILMFATIIGKNKRELDRWEAGFLFLFYAVYITYLIIVETAKQ